MKESYGERLATHTGPESCGVARKGDSRSVDKGAHGPDIHPPKRITPGRRLCRDGVVA